MFLYAVYLRFITSCFLFILCSGSIFFDVSQDQTTSRANTLLDDADDIQRQLDNEARDRIKYGRPKTIWVFHLPTQLPEIVAVRNVTRFSRDSKPSKHCENKKRRRKMLTKLKISVEASTDWSYKDQMSWASNSPDCAGQSQSPVDLPYNGLVETRGARKLVMMNYDVKPKSMMLANDGKRVILYGAWPKNKHPYIMGGAAHSRRYLFHSMVFRWPSEHHVGGFQYPLETQVMHVSAEYRTMEKAIKASVSDPLAFLAVSSLFKDILGEHPVTIKNMHVTEKTVKATVTDPMAILTVSSLYQFANHTHKGLQDIVKVAVKSKGVETVNVKPKPLYHFSPEMPEYACYQGSLTTPPCTEAVLWLVRGRTLPITRETLQTVIDLHSEHGFRLLNPMHDRKAYYFRN